MLAVITCQQANVIYIFIWVSQSQAPFIAGKNPFQCKYTFDEKIGCNSFILMMLKSFMNSAHFTINFSCCKNLEFQKKYEKLRIVYLLNASATRLTNYCQESSNF